MMHIVPYSFPTDFVPSTQTQAAPGQAQGVYILLHPDTIGNITDKMRQWFEARPEGVIVDVGTSDKRGFGFHHPRMDGMRCESTFFVHRTHRRVCSRLYDV